MQKKKNELEDNTHNQDIHFCSDNTTNKNLILERLGTPNKLNRYELPLALLIDYRMFFVENSALVLV